MTGVTVAATLQSPHFTEPEAIDVGGLEVAYRRKGSGPATLFLHGAGATRMWLPFYERMRASLTRYEGVVLRFGEDRRVRRA